VTSSKPKDAAQFSNAKLAEDGPEQIFRCRLVLAI
jgi:hypothetical protein